MGIWTGLLCSVKTVSYQTNTFVTEDTALTLQPGEFGPPPPPRRRRKYTRCKLRSLEFVTCPYCSERPNERDSDAHILACRNVRIRQLGWKVFGESKYNEVCMDVLNVRYGSKRRVR
jgi:ribosomal protein L37AE/L43A